MRIITALVLALLVVAPALAQSPPAKPGEAAAAPAAPKPPPPYEADLMHLVELIGALSHFAAICPGEGLGPSAAFRERALALIDAEAMEGPRRSRLIGFFNRGVTGYSVSHRTCTDAARLLIPRLKVEAAEISASIASRYGGT
jgi:uncharacterized protein (TIGR02301 family)